VLASFMATAVMFRSGLLAALTLGVLLPVYVYRIRVEERFLVQALGPDYEAYRARTARLLPGVW
jgi:protein-S-isoprenylcysteine O-methyltransferase Ste14